MLSLLQLLPPELAHELTLRLLPLVSRLMGDLSTYESLADHDGMGQKLFGRYFTHPFGMAAGFDKNGVVPRPLMRFGFSFVEVGTVTPETQAGNPQPRLFRLRREQGVINRMGFPSQGMVAVKANLEKMIDVEWQSYKNRALQASSHGTESIAAGFAAMEKKIKAQRQGLGVDSSWLWPCPLLVNVGINKHTETPLDDFAKVARALAPLATAVVVNVSSPNTAGLRALQSRDNLINIINKIRKITPKPLLLKLSPDLSHAQVLDLATFCIAEKIDGVILTNTTVSRFGVERSRHRDEAGGLSGRPLFALATRVLAQFYLASGGKIPIIGVGGVMSGADALIKIKAGASLVQGYSGYVYQGRGLLIDQIKILDKTLHDLAQPAGEGVDEVTGGADAAGVRMMTDRGAVDSGDDTAITGRRGLQWLIGSEAEEYARE